MKRRRGRHHFSRHARLIGRAWLFSFAFIIAYVVGIGLVAWRVEVPMARNEAAQGGAPVPAYLDVPAWVVPPFDDGYAFARYPPWQMTDPGFYVPVLIVALVVATFACLASRRIPPGVAFRHMRGVTPHDRRIAALRWRVTMARSAPPLRLWALAGAAGGLCTAIAGDAWAMIHGHLSQEAAWARGAPASVVFMKPVMGSLTVPDMVMLLAWSVLAPAALVVLRARERFMEREARLGGRCMWCGYPRAGTAEPCAECGRRPKARLRAGARGKRVCCAILAGMLVAAGVAFIVAPYLTIW